jgi:hypothetical protein
MLAGLAIPALMLAPTANAAIGITATFNPSAFGMDVTVNDTENLVPKQCGYTAVPQQPTLLQTVKRPFSLAKGGSQTLNFPGVPTGTTWRIFITCDYVGGPAGRSGGSLEQSITY